MTLKFHWLHLSGFIVVLTAHTLSGQISVPSVEIPAAPAESGEAGPTLSEPALLAPLQEPAPPAPEAQIPPPPPPEPPLPPTASPAGETPEEISPRQSTTDRVIANAAKRFGQFAPIGSITLPQQTTASMPPLLTVDNRQQPDVHYFSPPVVRPWENTVLRPHNRFCHQPLYFEEVNLERYGVRYPVIQPICSAAHFFGTVGMMPYHWALDHPMRCYHYPHPYLPGVNGFEAPPRLRLAPALVQASVMTGLILVSP